MGGVATAVPPIESEKNMMMNTNYKMLFHIALLPLFFTVAVAAGPFAPATGQVGSTAISKDDPNIIAWADNWCDYIVGTDVDAQWQTPEKALGAAVGGSFDIVCLGRGGQITLTFLTPIANGPGWDFATFENAVTDGFLELGYVEVSSDGVIFFRFNNYSLTSDPVPFVGGAVDPTNITGYCSKYRQGQGTPFDLNELAEVEGLDINAVTHIKIVDIVGDGTYTDTVGNPIYDPYPTIGSAGVDLDAIGVIHQKTLQADVNGDGIVNFEDYAAFSAAYLSTPEDPEWNYKCDVEPFINDYIDLNDILVLTEQWLLTEQWYDG